MAQQIHTPGAIPWQVSAPLLALLLLGIYAGSCWLFPFTKCSKCKGTGLRARKDGKVWDHCKRCKGTKERLRVGRWIWNYFAKVRKDSR